jgi:aspartyl-tRNA(Asn)/glutamyl-tRNA(Gln) amidotransferase subunit B
MEEDAGKNIHDDFTGYSFVDFNRCGVPLIEIVSKPDLNSSDEAVSYLEQVKETLVAIGVSDGKMQEGSLRCDVNVSIKPEGTSELGTRTEMKNLNSFKAVKRAIDYEVARQIKLVEAGEQVVQETRRWDDGWGESMALRSKENSQDYRYFPDRDLLPVTIKTSFVEKIKKEMPILPRDRRKHYVNNLGLPEYDANVLTQDSKVTEFFEDCLKLCNEPKAVSNFIMSHVLRLLKQNLNTENTQILITPDNLCAIIKMSNDKEISSSAAKELFEACYSSGKDARILVEELGLKQVNDESAFLDLVKEIIRLNPQAVADYKAGNQKAITFFMGQIMKASKGKANPSVINNILNKELNG